MTPRPLILALPLALLVACGPGPVRLAVPAVPAGEPVAVGFASVEVLDVSLPDYAEGPEVYVRGADLMLTPVAAVWADDPTRALTLDLVRALNEATAARVAGEPWPFDEPPEARLDLRVADLMVDEAAGTFVMAGQYYVGAFDGSGRDRARGFRVEVPVAAIEAAAIADARARATVQLAREVAAGGLG